MTNTSFGANSGFTFGVHDTYDVPFSTGNSPLAQRTIEGEYVLVGGDCVGRAFNVANYTDIATNEGLGTVVASKEVVFLDAAPVHWAHATFNSAAVLATNTNYYLVVQTTDRGSIPDFTWRVATNTPTYSNLGSVSFYQITGGNPSTANISARVRDDAWRNVGGTTVSVNSLGLQLLPEPSTWAMGFIGAVTLFSCRKRFLSPADSASFSSTIPVDTFNSPFSRGQLIPRQRRDLFFRFVLRFVVNAALFG